jgi:hypothetical protein
MGLLFTATGDMWVTCIMKALDDILVLWQLSEAMRDVEAMQACS